jgi:GT2 family glycosyltransferase
MDSTVIVPSVRGGRRLENALASLARQSAEHETIVVANGGGRDVLDVAERFRGVRVLSLEHNVGFGRAVNFAAAHASTETLVLLNDDCVCEDAFVGELVRCLAPKADIVMAAPVLLEEGRPAVVDSAGMELDSTLLVFDYMNGALATDIEDGVEPPIGPSAAAAAFTREAFVEVGGFDERLFAYWEDVDLVLRLRRNGGRCALAASARATHAHSATLGSGSPEKNYLTGFGRGYVARKWSAFAPRRLPSVLARDVVVCVGQAVIDRNVAGLKGRIDGFHAAAATPREPYPSDLLGGPPVTGLATLGRRLRRRRRMHARAAA